MSQPTIDGAALVRAASSGSNVLDAEVQKLHATGATNREIVQAMATSPVLVSPLRMRGGGTVKAPNTRPWGEWRDDITRTWQSGIEAIIETGTLLIQAKVDLDHGQFERMIRDHLPFTPSTARKLMSIAASPVISNRSHGNDLPGSWTILYELFTSRLPTAR